MRIHLLMCCSFLMGWGSALFAQDVPADTCATGQAEAYLDVNDVRARLVNTGNLFWNGSPDVYEVPQGSGINSIFTAGLWLGGMVGDSLHIAAARYGNYEFWPGPLAIDGTPPRNCQAFDRIYLMSRDIIGMYEKTGVVLPELEEWPVHLGAPVVDGDGDPLNYNLAGGDRPALLGHQMAWWVMNDRGGVHRSTGSDPVGIDVRVSAFAFDVAGALSATTFYRYQIHYHGEEPMEGAYVGFFVDPDIGNFDDDYIGSDTTLMMGYAYNADNDDEGEYREAPPALGVSFLQGPQAVPGDGKDNNRNGYVDETEERLEMTAFVYFNNLGNVQGDPTRGIEYYRYMRAEWKDGQRFTLGGEGRSFSNIPTNFVYPGDPITRTYWTEFSHWGTAPTTPSDRRMVLASGPFRMDPGATEDIVLALVWSRGSDHLDSIRKLRADMAFVQQQASEIMTPQLAQPRVSQPASVWTRQGYHRNYPNPFADQTTIAFELAQAQHVRLSVHNMLGQEVAVLVDGEREAGMHQAVFDAKGFGAGLYVYRLRVGWLETTDTMVLVR